MPDYLVVNDIHFADKPPSSCTETYNDDLFDLLTQTVTIAKDLDVTAVVWAGDVFHDKTPSRTSHRTILRILALIRSYPCKVYIVPGNHDLTADRLSSLVEGQPLQVLLESGAFLLDGAAPEGMLYGVPWQQDWKNNYADALAQFREEAPQDALLVTHCGIFPEYQTPPFDYIPVKDFAAALGWKGYVAYGHIHDYHGQHVVASEKGSVTFSNVGSLCRGSLHEYNLHRALYVTHWSPDGGFTEIELQYKPASEVLRVATKELAEKKAASLDEFLHSLAVSELPNSTVEGLVAEISNMDIDPPVKIRAAEYVQVEWNNKK